MIYGKIGILKERDPKCLSTKAVSFSEIEILDVCGNSFTFKMFTEPFQVSCFSQLYTVTVVWLDFREEGQEKRKDVCRLAPSKVSEI